MQGVPGEALVSLAATKQAMGTLGAPLFKEATSVYEMIASQGSGDQGLMDKEELVLAHGGDMQPFEKLDSSSDGSVTKDDWLGYLHLIYQEREEKTEGEGGQWVTTLLHTLKHNLEAEASEKAKYELGAPVLKESQAIFALIAKQDGDDADIMQKSELVAVHGGDFKLFEKLDTSADGSVSMDEWVDYLKKEYSDKEKKKQGKGSKWILTLLHTLTQHTSQHTSQQHNLQHTSQQHSVQASESGPVPAAAKLDKADKLKEASIIANQTHLDDNPNQESVIEQVEASISPTTNRGEIETNRDEFERAKLRISEFENESQFASSMMKIRDEIHVMGTACKCETDVKQPALSSSSIMTPDGNSSMSMVDDVMDMTYSVQSNTLRTCTMKISHDEPNPLSPLPHTQPTSTLSSPRYGRRDGKSCSDE